MRIFFIFMIKCYRKYLSPLLGSNCRFEPTCSRYALQAFEKYGTFKAMVLTLKRILKCHPFNKGGYDPLE